jgi:deazaflavin-dependent oxidoreductase (nitroreductase family)
MCANLSQVPSLPKTLTAVTAIAGATIGAALAYPPSRKQVMRTARAAIDEVLLRVDSPWSQDLLLVTTEGHRSHLPRTSVLARVEFEGEVFVVPWDRDAGWLRNVAANPDVVVDDRVKVRRARAEVVDGAIAEAVRAAFLERFVPEMLRGRLAGKGGPLGPGLPAVRLVSP